MHPHDIEKVLRVLAEHAWDREVTWSDVDAWAANFSGSFAEADKERQHALVALSRFTYFSKRLVREMLRSLYRDQFEAPLKQRIRRRLKHTRDSNAIGHIFQQEQAATRFIGVGNPSESGAHLLYYFRQVNRLPKSLFVDLDAAFTTTTTRDGRTQLRSLEPHVTRYVFFDDLVGSAEQTTRYLSTRLSQVRRSFPSLEIGFMCLFATAEGLAKLNQPKLFDGRASCLFELDSTYRAFGASQRYFPQSLFSGGFDPNFFEALARHYGQLLAPSAPVGFSDGQLMLGFTYNTPDNTLPIFWNEGRDVPWTPIFVRYDKVY